MFPIINTIDDVLPFIKDSPEFIIAQRDHFDVIQYVIQTPETFVHEDPHAQAIRRECRGLIFGKDGKLLSRPLHKFFNLNEKEETQQHMIDFSKKHWIFDKLDGSMIRPVPLHTGFRLATKMGITDVALKAENFMATKPKYFKFLEHCRECDCTPIFEFVSPDNRIVVKYPFTDLILLHVRDNANGKYVLPPVMKSTAERYGIPTVLVYDETIEDIQMFANDAREAKGIEGYIIMFEDGTMLKVKAEEYLGLHRSKEVAESARHIVKAVLDGSVDDLKSMLFDDDLKKVLDIETRVWAYVAEVGGKLDEGYSFVRETFGDDRKAFALYKDDESPDPLFDGYMKNLMFKKWDGRPTKQIMVDFMLSFCGKDKDFKILADELQIDF